MYYSASKPLASMARANSAVRVSGSRGLTPKENTSLDAPMTSIQVIAQLRQGAGAVPGSCPAVSAKIHRVDGKLPEMGRDGVPGAEVLGQPMQQHDRLPRASAQLVHHYVVQLDGAHRPTLRYGPPPPGFAAVREPEALTSSSRSCCLRILPEAVRGK